MEMLTPEEFFERVGVRVPDGVIRNLETRARRYVTEKEYKVLTRGEFPPPQDPNRPEDPIDQPRRQFELELEKLDELLNG